MLGVARRVRGIERLRLPYGRGCMRIATGSISKPVISVEVPETPIKPMTTSDQLNRDLETILELEAGSITGTETLAGINWDSLSVITFIALADSEYGLTVPASKLQWAETVADLLALTTDSAHKQA